MNFQEKINNALKAFKEAYKSLEDTVLEIESYSYARGEEIKAANEAIAKNNKQKEQALKAMKKIRSIID